MHKSSSVPRLPKLKPDWAPLEEPYQRRKQQWIQERRHPKKSASHGQLLSPSDVDLARRQSDEPREEPPALPQVRRRSKTSASGGASHEDDEQTPASSSRSTAQSGVGTSDMVIRFKSCKSAKSDTEPLPAPITRLKKRRNTLCDKLLEAKLDSFRGARKEEKQLLLAGRQEQGERFKTSPEQVIAVFNHTARSGSLAPGPGLAEAFLLLDYPYPGSDVLDDMIGHVCGGRLSIDREDFLGIVSRYEDRLRSNLKQVFKAHAPKGAMLGLGKHAPVTVHLDLLPRMLVQAGIKPIPGAVEELQAQFVEEHGEGARLTVEHFQRMYEDITSRASLTKVEHTRLSTLYEAFEDDRGMVGEEDLINLLDWNEGVVNLIGGREFIERVAEETIKRTQQGKIDLDIRSWMDDLTASPRSSPAHHAAAGGPRVERKTIGSAYLMAARIVHEKMLRILQATMQELQMSIGAGPVVNPTELVVLAEELGFLNVDPEKVDDFLKMCHMHQLNMLTFDQVYSFIFKFVWSNGLTDTEMSDIARAFRKFDADGSGTLEVPELSSLLRWLGYQATQYRVYTFAEEAGLEEDSRLKVDEFQGLVAKFMRSSLTAVAKVFKGREVTLEDLGKLLKLVGYDTTEEEVESLMQKAGGDPSRLLDFAEFKRLERIHRKAVRASMEENHGCTNCDLQRYKHIFATHCEPMGPNAEEYMTHQAMRKVLSGIFPDTMVNRDRHAKIAQLVRDADFDGNGIFDINEFMWLMRKVSDIMDRDNLYMGLRLKKELGYSHEEVKQFNDLYQICDDDMSGFIDAEELCNLFCNLIDMDQSAKYELMQRFNAVDDGDGHLDFWEFLHFMKNAQLENWRGISSASRM